uniref:Transmembrane protein 184C n=1 Tax=Helicotheca tamesis TaxID=374047 RepID=A0A7S2E3J1_9STRA|mmetsp:Transcript_11687/g.16205  ORF Transcript_11687/g.16205 Transcript_11687/m.16205 type:complete len:642 (+) Transcript_11687:224-2149(+)|eukprot:CAMPEP_0185731770 /NCGR_PEP_ID=MMETSP1171-20130828/13912_1 /TAXON_ID=374046 /ORGANISM="Helicotheca tamensis, Strain CCMP826" /LENGTH=641 /DNA_ID=CAMNT_0028401095 /DNA_START=153 /DNA_END=2078 /DNA_ORIENTATION=+
MALFTRQPTPDEARAAKMATLRNRIICLFFVILVGGLTFFFNWRVQQLSSQIRTEETRIKELSDQVGNQASIIDRFKGSVSNSDVIKRVDGLEGTLNETESRLNAKLEATQAQISDLLKETMKQLDTTVAEARNEISAEVEHVKADVDVYVAQTQDQFSMENSFMVYQIAGTFTLISALISMWHMTAHIRRFRQPFVQRKILAILWMSPIYSVTSWLSLVFPMFEGYFEIVKDFYEAYVIYQFLAFLIAVLGKGDRKAVVDLLAKHADHLSPPVMLCGWCRKKEYESDRAMADAVLLQCQLFAMQFVLFRPLTTITLFVLKETDYWGGGVPGNNYDWRSPQLYTILIQNASVFVAFSGLLKFYHAVQDDLSWCRPFPKFLCIKGIVFMTFWQGLAISILARTTLSGPDGDRGDEWAQQAQSFLICLEMLLFSLGHFYCFPTEEWEEGYRPAHEKRNFGDNMALGDFLEDIKLVMGAGKKSKRKVGKLSRTPSVSTVGDDGDDEEGGIADIEKRNLLDENGLGLSSEEDEDDDSDELNLNDIESNQELSQDVRDAAARVRNSLREAGGRSSQREDSKKKAKEQSGGYAGKPSYSSIDECEDEGPSETTSLLQRDPPKAKESGDTLRPSIFTTLGKMDEDTTL